MGYVYFLEDSKGKYYIGSTTDLDRRLRQHFSGHTHTTKRMLNLKLVFSQKFDNLEDARKIELKLKRLKRKDYLKRIVEDGHINMPP